MAVKNNSSKLLYGVKQTNDLKPNLELKYLKSFSTVVGIDEVGVGPLAGPVVAACVMFSKKSTTKFYGKQKWWTEIRDSKKLTHKKREELFKTILKHCQGFGIGSCDVLEIDKMNIYHARFLAMRRALRQLKRKPKLVLVDGNKTIPEITVTQKSIVKGDEKVLSIASASILAKVTRDNILNNLHKQFPEYGFDKHKGYPTKFHKEKILEHGPCDVHRKTFGLVREILNRS